ncbi:DUF465 domain-containing protein [Chelatococcus reniformis]|uniref:DUF465 domain-containing protein n=1 Tax=Chelatococcus reniformis TaxID=1494448 RepID=A0A916XDP8_9HYPH|nr:DUF465 domain-containing protein [Chelatococcus reniformis]GGC64110.1 hypothetical protein GCM10010994_23450 [Chelatococcus reniformis]
MSVQSHLAELERRHRAIELELQAATSQPATPDLKLAELKRKKLLLKDQIARLRQTSASASIH